MDYVRTWCLDYVYKLSHVLTLMGLTIYGQHNMDQNMKNIQYSIYSILCWKREKNWDANLQFSFFLFPASPTYSQSLENPTLLWSMSSHRWCPPLFKKKKCCQINVWIRLSKNVVKSMCESSQGICLKILWQPYPYPFFKRLDILDTHIFVICSLGEAL